jgi:ABC-2 type transport system ATP-binding protein
MKYAIEATNLSKQFADKLAVSDVSFAITPGEIYGFLGPNGAGKSTTVRMLVTLTEPSSGDANIYGHSVTKQEGLVRLDIGVALQEAALDPTQRGMEFLKLQAHLYGLRGASVATRLSELEKLVDIGEAIHKPISTYSGGMKRRLDLAAALVHNPKVLFLDEPTTGLDPTSRMRVWDEIRRLNKELGMTIFLTTQYLEEADQLCDRVAIISDGRLKVEGTPTELKASVGADTVTARLTSPKQTLSKALGQLKSVVSSTIDNDTVTIAIKNASSHMADLMDTLTKHSTGVKELSVRTPTLDDVFMQVTGSHLKGDD